MTLQDVEIVTPEGRFASIRTPTVIDAFASGYYGFGEKNYAEVLLKLCTLCVKLDGEPVSQEVLGNLPVYEVEAVMAKLVELIKSPPKGRKA